MAEPGALARRCRRVARRLALFVLLVVVPGGLLALLSPSVAVPVLPGAAGAAWCSAGLINWCSDRLAELSASVSASVPMAGLVEDCATDFATVDAATHAYFSPLLASLGNTTFFSFFKVNLNKQCPFWPNDGQCAMEHCAVCECPAEEVPAPWREALGGSGSGGGLGGGGGGAPMFGAAGYAAGRADCDEPAPSPGFASFLAKVDRGGLGGGAAMPGQRGGALAGWSEPASPHVWIVQDDSEPGTAYVNLRQNPHGFTGYVGEHPRRVWGEIWKAAGCEGGDGGGEEGGGGAAQCFEERVFYRLVSGMQASVATHIAKRYAFRADESDPTDSGVLGVNMPLWVQRVGRHPERLQNLYFAYLFMMRAVARAGTRLLAFNYSTGDGASDARAHALLQRLVSEPLAHTRSCPSGGTALLGGFDETALFRDPDEGLAWPSTHEYEQHVARRAGMKLRMRDAFRNISRIMDCVGCEKCRLYGKLQVLGLGTALKLLFESKERRAGGGAAGSEEPLQRNEVIALVNTLAEFAESVAAVREFRQAELEQVEQRLIVGLASVLILVCGGVALVCCSRRRKKRRSKERRAKAAA